jgi:hypothetical protein
MLSGTAEPECRERPPEILPALRDAVNGADQAVPRPAATPTSANNPPHPEATNAIRRATIHPNGMATAGCLTCSPAVI